MDNNRNTVLDKDAKQTDFDHLLRDNSAIFKWIEDFLCKKIQDLETNQIAMKDKINKLQKKIDDLQDLGTQKWKLDRRTFVEILENDDVDKFKDHSNEILDRFGNIGVELMIRKAFKIMRWLYDNDLLEIVWTKH